MTSTLTVVASSSAGKATKSAKLIVTPRLGMTVNVQAGLYPGTAGGPVDMGAAAAADNLTGLTLARSIQKVYLNLGQLPVPVLAAWKTYVAAGGRLLISFRPNPVFSASQDAAFDACVSACRTALGTSWKGVLWQEPNTQTSSLAGMTSSSLYQNYTSHYGPRFRTQAPGIPLVYCPALCGTGDQCNATSCAAYFPQDHSLVDEFYVDFYGTAWYGTRGGKLEDVVGLADGAGIPFGLGEWGPSASSTWTWNAAQWQSYVNYLTAFFVARRGAGKRTGWLLYWGANDEGRLGSMDVVMNSADPKIPGIQSFAAALGG